jgi:hypothetical protein
MLAAAADVEGDPADAATVDAAGTVDGAGAVDGAGDATPAHPEAVSKSDINAATILGRLGEFIADLLLRVGIDVSETQAFFSSYHL